MPVVETIVTCLSQPFDPNDSEVQYYKYTYTSLHWPAVRATTAFCSLYIHVCGSKRH